MAKVTELTAELAAPIVAAAGCTLWDVEYVKEAGEWFLRVYIDKEGGVNIDDCEAVHRAIDPVLDEADPIPVQYYLEVSSPGVERELRTCAHFEYAVGREIDLKFFTAIDGSKQLTGVLNSFDPDGKTLTVGERLIPLDAVSKANIHFDFDDN